MTHTPGPWSFVDAWHYNVQGEMKDASVVIDENQYDVLQDVNRHENARLIAAAPELLEALEGVMEFYPNAIGFSDEKGAYLEEDYFRAIDAEDKAEQALALVEGDKDG